MFCQINSMTHINHDVTLKRPSLFFFFFPLVCEGIFIKMQTLKYICYTTGIYTVCRLVLPSFSPEIVEAAAVKGLILGTSINTTLVLSAFTPTPRHYIIASHTTTLIHKDTHPGITVTLMLTHMHTHSESPTVIHSSYFLFLLFS